MGVYLPEGAREVVTPAWRIWVWDSRPPAPNCQVYVTATPETWPDVAGAVGNHIAEYSHMVSAARLSVSPKALQELNNLPEWAGKAATIYLTATQHAEAFAAGLDRTLSGKGNSGPAVAASLPWGGKSRSVYIHTGGSHSGAGQRRNSLANLLGG